MKVIKYCELAHPDYRDHYGDWHCVGDLSGIPQAHSLGCRDSRHCSPLLVLRADQKIGGIQNSYKQALASLQRLDDIRRRGIHSGPGASRRVLENQRENCDSKTYPFPMKTGMAIPRTAPCPAPISRYQLAKWSPWSVQAGRAKLPWQVCFPF